MLGMSVDVLDRSLLHRPGRVEHHHPVTKAGYDTQVVGDEQDR